MGLVTRSVMLLSALMVLTPAVRAQDSKPYAGPACTRQTDDYFAREVWPKVGAHLCLQCHKKGGDAEASRLILQDPRKVQGHAQDEVMQHRTTLFIAHRLTSAARADRILMLNRGEVVESGSPVRPILALGQIAPRLVERILTRAGTHEWFRRVAAERDRA